MSAVNFTKLVMAQTLCLVPYDRASIHHSPLRQALFPILQRSKQRLQEVRLLAQVTELGLQARFV